MLLTYTRYLVNEFIFISRLPRGSQGASGGAQQSINFISTSQKCPMHRRGRSYRIF